MFKRRGNKPVDDFRQEPTLSLADDNPPPNPAPTGGQAATPVDHFMEGLKRRNPGETEFHQAVHEVACDIIPFLEDHAKYRDARILERMTEPDRIVIFRVVWEDKDGEIRANRAWRVQFNSAIGPYKGGLRFHPELNQSVLKFLGFEQCFKNALTGLPMGGAKGGANFNPRGRTDAEVMRFCHSLMIELHRHIGEDTDVPAGDIGVGEREISYLFGMYKRLSNRFTGTLTGKGLTFGGSAVRKEATGYGLVLFTDMMLAHQGDSLKKKRVVISGSGAVAIYAAEKAMASGAKVITLSDTTGTLVDPDGLTPDKLALIKHLKEVQRTSLFGYTERIPGAQFEKGAKPWGVPCEVALACATQNELEGVDARRLVENGVRLVAEGANMPATAEAITIFRENGILFGPAKAANAGGVAVSGLEQTQNAMRLSWSRQEVEARLEEIMAGIHKRCVAHGETSGRVDYAKGANIAGFVKVADAMLAHGAI